MDSYVFIRRASDFISSLQMKICFPITILILKETLLYMSYLDWYDAKFIKKSWSFQNRCVFPLFSRKEKSATWISSKLLIFSVDQPGLEPGTSRLWVCCSNQLSYKSNREKKWHLWYFGEPWMPFSLGCATRIRTWNDRTKTCSVTITP